MEITWGTQARSFVSNLRKDVDLIGSSRNPNFYKLMFGQCHNPGWMLYLAIDRKNVRQIFRNLVMAMIYFGYSVEDMQEDIREWQNRG